MTNSILILKPNYALWIKHRIIYIIFTSKRLRVIPFIVSVLLGMELCAQNRLVDEFNHKKASEFSGQNFDSLIFYSRKMQNSVNHCRKLTGLLYESNGYYEKWDLQKSKNLLSQLEIELSHNKNNYNYYQSDLLVGNNCKDCLQIVSLNMYRRLFYIAKNEDKYQEALHYLNKRLQVVENLPNRNKYIDLYKKLVRKLEADNHSTGGKS